MPDLSPEEMAAMQGQEEKQEGGDATMLVKEVGSGLAQLAQMLDKSPGCTDQDREQMGQVMSLFTDLVEKKLGGSAPGEDQAPEEMPADQGAVSAQGGMKGVPMGPQSRQ